MKITVTPTLLKATAVALFALTPLFGQAQTYPDRSFKILQVFAAGGNADAVAVAVWSRKPPLVIRAGV